VDHPAESVTNRGELLGRLSVGDIFHARAPNGASLVCLVTAVEDGTIRARRIHTQEDVEFDRATGFQRRRSPARIDCVTPLPPDIHKNMLALDRKYQEISSAIARGHQLEEFLEQIKFTKADIRAGLFLDQHWTENAI
jgi:hypothetical protein